MLLLQSYPAPQVANSTLIWCHGRGRSPLARSDGSPSRP
nr:MAG TPA: hypothetical protein [Microviridae sp.]